ncbi:SchA/CurD-like domain-containing protein [Streptomyces sp. ICBB 8177]|uniref:SchA/CurD-like domain-containing protein n=1 Tax=Streptomyces sp. ICBB 8177 TaxID=563922 RepID=UPI000D67C007|nr:SchA/CurD-like domain-containing protein [Streptomyces sp. ICBB 8177]PWI42948.1 TcmI family type II polyketide cyclase [Streptomyces sp. ICBB 8177]
MTSPTTTVSQSALDDSRLRVVLLVDVVSGAEDRFLEAYAQMSRRVSAVPGHLSDQLCQSIENPSQWLITSEWESALAFLAWVDSPVHLEMVEPMHGCVRDTRSLRFSVMRETPGGIAVTEHLTAPPRRGDGVVRHAITFTVRPGSEPVVADILAGYTSPQPVVDDTTRLCRTTLFMHRNRVVRAVEVRGELVRALRHVAAQPEVRAVEKAIDPYLEQERDLSDPNSARTFFAKAALPAVHHVGVPADRTEGLRRHALLYPTRPGCGTAVARLLARHDESGAARPDGPVAAATVFLRDDLVVRLVDLREAAADHPADAIGASGPRKAAVLARLLDPVPESVPRGADGAERLLAAHDMRLITDRRAATG